MDSGGIDGHGRLHLTTISHTLGAIVNGHGDGGDKHVDDIADNPPHHKRFYRADHAGGLEQAAGEKTKMDAVG